MKKIYEALDGKQFISKLHCKNHDFYLQRLKSAVDRAFDSGVFYILKRPDKKTPIFNSNSYYKKDFSYRSHGYNIGYNYTLKFSLRKDRLNMIWIGSFDDGSYTTYIGTVYLNKLK